MSESTIETTVTETTETDTEAKAPEKEGPNPDVARLQEALAKERDARKAAEKVAKENAAFRAKAEQLESANKTELERALDAARKEGEAKASEQVAAAVQRVNSRLVTAEVRALAAEKQFRNPVKVAKLLDLDSIEVSDDGTVDVDAISKQLDQLAKEDSYLLVDTKPTRPQGDVGQGPRPPVTPEVTPGMGRLRAAYATKTTK